MLHCSNSPMSRHGHSSTVVTINESAYLIVIGGVNDYLSVINDLCILDIKAKKWQKVIFIKICIFDMLFHMTMRYHYRLVPLFLQIVQTRK